jgi:hypothetical protein
MEIAVSSTWPLADLARYGRTRFPPGRFVPLAVYLGLAATAGELTLIPQRVLLALAWLLEFRLADDLADRPRDRRDHPERVLARADARPFVVLLVGLGACNTLLTAWLRPWPRWVEFLALTALLLLWYAATYGRSPPPLIAGLVVLLKYPGFVYLLSDPGGERDDWLRASVLVLVYATFVAHEVLHDRRLWTEPGAQACLIAALAAMAAAALLLAWRSGWPAWYVAGCVGPGCVVLAWLWRRRFSEGLWPYGVFLVSFVWIVCASLLPPLP